MSETVCLVFKTPFLSFFLSSSPTAAFFTAFIYVFVVEVGTLYFSPTFVIEPSKHLWSYGLFFFSFSVLLVIFPEDGNFVLLGNHFLTYTFILFIDRIDVLLSFHRNLTFQVIATYADDIYRLGRCFHFIRGIC